jgi:uncharacterized Fe-S cluster protein YjdI
MAPHTGSVSERSDVQTDASAGSAHVRKDYAADGIVVHWDSSLCIHSANCMHGLPEVFDVRRRPWVRVDRADADRIAQVVDTCPSRALTYTRLDGAEPGPNGLTEAPPAPAATPGDGVPVVVALKPDGPLAVEGPVRIEMARGEVIEVTDRAFLCRCGGSSNKPFCDGTHKRIGFQAPGW